LVDVSYTKPDFEEQNDFASAIQSKIQEKLASITFIAEIL
jgi:hypothetical protein